MLIKSDFIRQFIEQFSSFLTFLLLQSYCFIKGKIRKI